MIFFDTETFSETPIRWGTYRYTSICEPLVATYAKDDDPVECWDITAGGPMPQYLEYLLEDTDDEIVSHFAMFDRNVLKYGLKKDIPIPRWRCSMTKALAHALPGGLDLLCEILDVPLDQRKLKTGRQLVRLFCMPRPKNSKLRRATRETNPAEWLEFLDYAKFDIPSMRAVWKKLPNWNYSGEELALYHLDQRMNDLGVPVDVDLARAAVSAVERAKIVLKGRTIVLTNDEVESTTKRDQLLAHILREYGIDLPDAQKSTLERRIQDENLPRELRELLSIRLQASSTSTAKYQALLNGVMPDGRLRGTQQFSGAGRTRRWAHRGFQPGNLPRPDMDHADIEAGIEAIKGDYEDLVFPDVMSLASNAVRGCIAASAGRKLVIADLANIEGRDQAWLAGEEWKLQAFREYDTVKGTDGKWYGAPEYYAAALRREYIELGLDAKGEPVRKGPDMYKLAYAKAFKIPHTEVTRKQRQIGKVMELMLGYEGGVGAYVTGSATYGVDLEALAKTAWDTLPGDVVYEATSFLEWTRKEGRTTFGLSDEVFITCDSLKRMWRRAHPAISSIWKELKDASVEAIDRPGNTFTVRRFKLRRDGAWFRIQLPSGRCLCYPSPQVKNGTITYLGTNQYSRKWGRLGNYGGKEFEQACQSLAGDFLKANLPRIVEEGYELFLTVHDEAACETPDLPAYDHRHLSALMAIAPVWAPDMPLAAEGFTTYRYRKG